MWKTRVREFRLLASNSTQPGHNCSRRKRTTLKLKTIWCATNSWSTKRKSRNSNMIRYWLRRRPARLLWIINLDDIWVTANFKETQLRQMQVGQPVTIAVDSNGKKYKGHVQSIAGASGSITSLLPPENATGNYVKVVQRIPVKITFDPGETKEHALRPGMSVEPKVWIR